MPQTGGVAPPRARRRRPAPQAFGFDLEWESASDRAPRRPVAEPVTDPRDEPWFAALPPDLLAPAGDDAQRERDWREALSVAELAGGRTADDEPLAAAGPSTPTMDQPDPEPTAAPIDPVEASWAPTYDPVTGRRTVTIRGRGAERATPPARASRRDRPPVPRHERATFRADRTAMWAVLLGVMLLLAAVTSAHGATLQPAVHHHAAAHLAPLVRQLPDLSRAR